MSEPLTLELSSCLTFAESVHRILKIQLGTKPVTRGDMEELRSALHDLQEKLNSIVSRIPTSENPANPSAAPESETTASAHSCAAALPGDDGPSGCHEQYHSAVLVAFHKWTRILLSLFIDKVRLPQILSSSSADMIAGLLRRLPAFSPESAESNLAICATVVSAVAQNQLSAMSNQNSALRHCYAFMEKFIQLAADPDFKPFRWGWPG